MCSRKKIKVITYKNCNIFKEKSGLILPQFMVPYIKRILYMKAKAILEDNRLRFCS